MASLLQLKKRYHNYKFAFLFLVAIVIVLNVSLLAVAFAALYGFRHIKTFLIVYLGSTLDMLIGFALIGILLCGLGLYGLFKNKVPILVWHSVLLVILFVPELTYVAVGGHFYIEEELNLEISNSLTKHMAQYEFLPSSEKKIDSLQEHLLCCGSTGFEDWINQYGYVPESCCPGRNKNRDGYCDLIQDFQYMFTNGCLKALEDAPKVTLIVFLSLFSVLFLFEITTFVLSIFLVRCLSASIRSAKRPAFI